MYSFQKNKVCELVSSVFCSSLCLFRRNRFGVSELTNKLFTYDRVLGVKRMTTVPFLRSLRSWRYCRRARNKVLAAEPRGE